MGPMQFKAVYFCIFLRLLTLVSPNSTQIHAELTGTSHKVRIYAALVRKIIQSLRVPVSSSVQ